MCPLREGSFELAASLIEETARLHPDSRYLHLSLIHIYQREFSMDELAEALHLSKSYLSTSYKSKTGANLSDRIQFFRIQKAVELLADPKLLIGDIGALVGINNVNTFLRQFKKYTGMTPREYRLRKLSMQ